MTLSKRALLLIFPVVLASYVLIAISVYVAQRSAVIRLEQARLSQQLNTLKSLFESQVTFNRSFIRSVVRGSPIRQYLNEKNEAYRSNALGARLQESIQSLSENPKRFMSVTVFRPETLGVDFYFENSRDPFAEISDKQIELARKVLAGNDISTWNYLADPNLAPLIIHSEFLDPKTFSSPLPSQKKNSVLVQVAVRPDEFIALKGQLEKEYGAKIEFSQHPVFAQGTVSAATGLGRSVYIRLTASQDYLDDRLSAMWFLLAAAGLGMSILSLGLLLFLIRRYITNPVARLDRQVTEVMEGTRARIFDIGGSGEIARLSTNMKLMYDNLSRSLARIQEMSWTDPLTRISNRTAFNIKGSEFVAGGHGRDCRYAMLFIDLDNFKFVNDSYGHDSGDALLRTFADNVGQILNRFWKAKQIPEGLFARLSGDEFAILMRVDDDHDADKELATLILSMFANGLLVDGRSFPVSASIGLAHYPDSASSVTQLTSKADMAMYQAKAAGKNRWAAYSPELELKTERERVIQGELRLLDPDEQFSLAFMPIVDGAGKILSCEALLRWTSPTLGIVSPAEFVPIAESNGLFAKIDHWVIDRAMSHAVRLREAFGPDFILSINLSSAELHSGEINRYLADCLQRHGVEASAIEIELTETFAADINQKIGNALLSLRAMGFRIAIDDFGVGYTSIRQLIEYPADTIKLDLVIVRQMTETRSAGLLASLVSLCHARNMKVVAEGIDTEEKRRMLVEAGCDLFQGFLIAKPMDIEDFYLFGLQNAVSSGARDLLAMNAKSA